jgi:excinuclease ABC subunit B
MHPTSILLLTEYAPSLENGQNSSRQPREPSSRQPREPSSQPNLERKEAMNQRLEVVSNFVPRGDQPKAIEQMVDGLESGYRFQTLLGITGSGKTYSIAKTIEAVQRPALIVAPNKILTAQLAGEFREFFPNNAVEFFVSYYDYYQPEAYVPGKDLFIEKDSAVNQEIERLRHSTTRSLLTRRDVIVVASVSCIYGLGNPEAYKKMNLYLEVGKPVGRDAILERLVEIQYERNDIELLPGRFRAKGDTLEIWCSYDLLPMRLQLWGDELEKIDVVDLLTGEIKQSLSSTIVYPAKHYVTEQGNIDAGIAGIEGELASQLEYFNSVGKLLEAQRLKERTLYDLEMLRVLGYCSGIENYSRHIDGRQPGERPYTLLDYFPDDFITFLDESHISHSQIGGMFKGDYARKKTLSDYGFRLPSCMDNRPLKTEEFYEKVGQVLYVSATPAEHERSVSSQIVDQVIRPTGLIDPKIELRPTLGQVEDLLGRIRVRSERDERVLVTTLTKRMSEDLTEYFLSHNVKARYLHSEIDTLERQEIIRDLRLGHFDVLVGINLLREGLDLPEVSLVAILDADKPGFLRSERSLIQTIGRAARNLNGEVVLYGDSITPAMKFAMDETERRRNIQEAYNLEHGIVPQTVSKSIRKVIRGEEAPDAPLETAGETLSKDDILSAITDLELDMWQASESMDFEAAARLRDEIRKLEAKLAGKEVKTTNIPGSKAQKRGRGKR